MILYLFKMQMNKTVSKIKNASNTCRRFLSFLTLKNKKVVFYNVLATKTKLILTAKILKEVFKI